MTTLAATMTASALLNLYNGAIIEYGAPEGFDVVKRFPNKEAAETAIEALCKAGNLFVEAATDGTGAFRIVDLDEYTAPKAPEGEGEGEGEGDEAPEGGMSDEADAELAALQMADAEEARAATVATGGADGKGKVRAWGFALGSDAWLEANPRGTPAREAYRKARRQAARGARKAKAAALDALAGSGE